jgi:hypothetical protein
MTRSSGQFNRNDIFFHPNPKNNVGEIKPGVTVWNSATANG